MCLFAALTDLANRLKRAFHSTDAGQSGRQQPLCSPTGLLPFRLPDFQLSANALRWGATGDCRPLWSRRIKWLELPG